MAALFVWTMADGQSFAQGCSQLYDGVLRLHILANSDSESDQQLRLRVRDRVLQTAQQLGLGENCTELPQLVEQTQQLLSQLEQAAQQEVWRSGSDQKVTAYLTRMYFDTREYEDFTMPAGVYQAVRFTIGKGEGQQLVVCAVSADVHPDSSAARGRIFGRAAEGAGAQTAV